MIKMKSTLGPAAPGGYVQATGIPVVFGEFQKVNRAEAFCDRGQVLGAVDTNYSLSVVITGTTVAIHVWTESTVGGPGNALTELAGATALDARTFTVIADGD